MAVLRARIAGISKESVVDGSGIRYTVFFQGCSHGCPGCHNPDTWDPEGGEEMTLHELLEKLPVYPLINGITLSGGDPFLQAVTAAELAACFKRADLSVWVYTGYTWEELLERWEEPGFEKLLVNTDVIVDGPFKRELRSLNLPFRGSANQRLIDVPASLADAKLVEYKLDKVVNP